jgi:hypothetical protein
MPASTRFPALAVSGCRLVRGVMQGSATCDEFTSRSSHYKAEHHAQPL